jgi:hypothetical protein
MFRRRKRSHQDFSAELQSHIALEVDRLRAEGCSEEEASARAQKAFGNVLRSEERFFESGRTLWLDNCSRTYAMRCGDGAATRLLPPC